MSLSLVAVFMPFMLAGGIVGRLFREFTVTLSVAILISLVISLTTTPMMCSLLLEPRSRDASRSRFARWLRARVRARCGAATCARSDWALDHRRIDDADAARDHRASTSICIVVIPKGFFPQQDTGQLQGGIRGDATSSFQLMKRKLQRGRARSSRTIRRSARVTGSVGGGGFGPFGGGGASANVTIALKPLSAARRIGRPGHRPAAAASSRR